MTITPADGITITPDGMIFLITYCIACWFGMLFVASWRVAKEKRKGKEVDLWVDDDWSYDNTIMPNGPMIIFAPIVVPFLVAIGIGWLIGRIPHIIAAGFADIQERMDKKNH